MASKYMYILLCYMHDVKLFVKNYHIHLQNRKRKNGQMKVRSAQDKGTSP